MKVQTSLDWQEVSKHLVSSLNALPYNRDLLKMYKNIEGMIDNLSKIEVEARRVRSTYMVETKVLQINQAIDHLEKLLLIAKLMA